MVLLSGIKAIDDVVLLLIKSILKKVNKNFIIKFHPIYSNLKFADATNISVTNKPTFELLSKINKVIVCGPTSAIIECIYLNLRPIIINITEFEKLMLKKLNVSDDKYILTKTESDLINSLNLDLNLTNGRRDEKLFSFNKNAHLFNFLNN